MKICRYMSLHELFKYLRLKGYGVSSDGRVDELFNDTNWTWDDSTSVGFTFFKEQFTGIGVKSHLPYRKQNVFDLFAKLQGIVLNGERWGFLACFKTRNRVAKKKFKKGKGRYGQPGYCGRYRDGEKRRWKLDSGYGQWIREYSCISYSDEDLILDSLWLVNMDDRMLNKNWNEYARFRLVDVDELKHIVNASTWPYDYSAEDIPVVGGEYYDLNDYHLS